MRFFSDSITMDRGLLRAAGLAAGAALLVAAGAGCSSTSVFSAHTGRMKPVIRELETGQPVAAGKLFESEVRGNDAVLYRMERGRVALLAGDRAQSVADFAAAMAIFEQQDAKALVTASGAGAQTVAVALNDNVIPYEGEGYERVMVMTLQCLNQLLNGHAEATQDGRAGAKPVAIRLIREQQNLQEQHQKEIDKAGDQASDSNDANAKKINAHLAEKFAGMDAVAGKVKSSFQNAYAFTVAALVLELTDDPENAKIIYRKALELVPDCTYLQRDVARLAEGRPAVTGDQGEIVLFYESGFVAPKEEIKFPVPLILQGKLVSSAVAFPYYSVKLQDPFPLHVNEGSVELGKTETLCQMNVLAIKALKEHIPALVTRQVLRTAAKGAAAYGATSAVDRGGQGDPLATLAVGLAVGIWNYVSENADQRSWLTLPQDVQMLRVPVPAGIHNLELRHAEAAGITATPLTVTVRSGGKTVVWVAQTNFVVRTQSVVFPQDAPPPGVAPVMPEGAPAPAAPATPVAPPTGAVSE